MDFSGNAFKSPLVNVSEGDVLTGIMQMIGNSDGRFNYTCEFSGLANTKLTVNNANQLVMPVETLEAYTIEECRDYPGTWLTSMRSISVNTVSGARTTSFSASNSVTDCGQHAMVQSNAAGAGQIDLFYTTLFAGPAPSLVASVDRSPDQLDLFVVGTDGGVCSRRSGILTAAGSTAGSG